MSETFGAFLRRKRLDRGYTLRGFAGMADLSPVYMSNLENDRKPAPKEDVLNRIGKILELSRDDLAEMFDLAAKTKNKPSVAVDLPEYINENDIVRVALRTAKEADATDEEWQDFIERVSRRVAKSKEKE